MGSEMIDPVRPAFEVGAKDRRASHAVWPLLTVLVLACVACSVLARTMSPDVGVGARLVEAPVAAGSWSIEWGRRDLPPSAEQASQTHALREVTAGSAALVALLSLLIAVGLWRQRVRLRRGEDYVHWAAGARRIQLAARLAGEAWRWAVFGLVFAGLLAYVLPFAIERTFPGRAEVPPGIATALILSTALTVMLLRSESRVGQRAARPGRSMRPIASSPAAIAAVGFTVLTGVGLLSRHAPGTRPAVGGEGSLVAAVSLSAIPAARRARAVTEWIERSTTTSISSAGGRMPLGIASAGATRGTGHRAEIWVECGDCYEGGLPLPIRTVRAEVHAVAADTFPHLGLRVIGGRDFDDHSDRGDPDIAIVSRALAARHFEDGVAIGRRIRIGDSRWLTVVGVVSDGADVRDPTEYAVYLPLTQAVPSEIELFGETSRATMAGWLGTAPEGAETTSLRTAAEVFALHGWFAALMRLLGGLAYVLVVAGVCLGSRNEARATVSELALRRAVGARRRDLHALFMASSAKQIAIAIVAGAWLSLFLGAGLNSAFGSIPQIDWLVWLRTGVLVGAAQLVGAWLPHARAARAMSVAGLRALA